MATPTEAQVNSDTIAAHDALVAAANAAFIVDLDIMVAQKVAQGKFAVAALTKQNVSFKDIANHYNDLGYKVSTPNCPYFTGQPCNLFGEFWAAYWNNRWICRCKKPCKIRISWR